MKAKRKDTDYLFLSSRVRCLERNLLTAQRLEQMLLAPTVEGCAQVLVDLGYEPIHDEASLQDALRRQRETVFADLARFMPEPELLQVFRLKYDYHNIKTLLKSRGADCSHLLVDAGSIPVEEMQFKHTESGAWHFLPEPMACAAAEAAAALAETGNAQRSDFILDRAYFSQLSALAQESRCEYLQAYVRAMIDAANLRSLVRAWRLKAGVGFLQQVLFDGGSVSVHSVLTNAASGAAAVYRSTPLQAAAELGDIAERGGSLTAFEQACDNAVLNAAKAARGVPFGIEVVLGYLVAKENEWTAVRIVMSGRMAGIAPESIRERLRDCYV